VLVARRPTSRVWWSLAIVYVVWGSTYLAIRFSVQTTPPLLSAAARFLLAGALLALGLRWRRGPTAWSLSWAEARTAAVAGVLLLVGGNGLVVLAEQHVPSGLAALLVAAVPLWLVLLRRAVGERTQIVTLFGVLVGLGGVAVLLLPGSRGGQVRLLYCVVVLVAALSWALGSLVSARGRLPPDPLLATTVEMLSGGAVLLTLAAVGGEFSRVDLGHITLKSWLALAYLVVFGSLIAFSAYVWLLGHAPTSLVATYAYVNPAVAVLLGALLAGERLTLVELLGGGVIVASVVIVVRAEARSRAAPSAPAAEDAAEASEVDKAAER
jgi:drug/metabolite transporter (DMT)-like permease